MKKTKNNGVRGRNFWMTVLGFVGFSACDNSIAEYGCPCATFIINGDVQNAFNEQPVRDIKVTMNVEAEDSSGIFWAQVDSAQTNAQGLYSLRYTAVPENPKFKLRFIDTDGELHGAFAPKDTIIDFENAEYKNPGESWYRGEASKVVNVKLNPL